MKEKQQQKSKNKSKGMTVEEEIQEEEGMIEELRGQVYTVNGKGKITVNNVYNKGFSNNLREVIREGFSPRL